MISFRVCNGCASAMKYGVSKYETQFAELPTIATH